MDFFIAHISHERESDAKLGFYITREKTAVYASFECGFPAFLLSAGSELCWWIVPRRVHAEGHGREVRRNGICGSYTLNTGY